MRASMRWGAGLVILLVAAGGALWWGQDRWARTWTERQLQVWTGMDARMDSCEVGLLDSTFQAVNLRLFDPASDGHDAAVVVPFLYLEMDAARLARRALKFRLVRMHLAEWTIVREGSEGEGNSAEWLRFDSTDLAESGGYVFEGIDRLEVTLGRIRFFDAGRPERQAEVDFERRLEVITNLTSPDEIVQALMQFAFRQGIRFGSVSEPRP